MEEPEASARGGEGGNLRSSGRGTAAIKAVRQEYRGVGLAQSEEALRNNAHLWLLGIS